MIILGRYLLERYLLERYLLERYLPECSFRAFAGVSRAAINYIGFMRRAK
jgi:hypothetical protein